MMNKDELTSYPFNASDLRAVCAGYADGLVASAEAVSLDFEPSETHRNAVRHLMDKSLQRAKRHTSYRRIGTIAALFVLLFSTVMVTNAHARELFVRWMKQVFPNRVMYQFYGESVEGLNNYRIGWLPEGFELENQFEFQGIRVYSYRSQDEGFTVSFNTIEDGFILEIEGAEGFKSLPVYINGVKGTYYYDNQSKNLVWITADENVEIDIEGSISYEMMMKIAESIYIAKPRYTVGWIPEGFELVDEDESDTSGYYVYESETGESFVFYYEQTDPINFTEYIPLGDYSHETVQILDKTADLYLDKSIDGNLTVIWVDDENHCILSFDAIMEKDKLLKIAASVIMK